jgi:hypothetical protein
MFAGSFTGIYLLKKAVEKIVSAELIFRQLSLVKHENRPNLNLYTKPTFYLRAFNG